jgi:DNA-binding transcriptional regulator YdaS (Cro superfamily)
MSPRKLIQQAIREYESELKLARAIGYSQHGVWRAKKLGRVSPRMALSIETVSKGRFKREHLCPEVFGTPESRKRHNGRPHHR